jgi:hypothetical protein
MKVVGAGLDRLPVILAGVGEAATPEAKAAANAATVAALADIFGKADPDTVTRLVADIVRLATVQRPSGAWEQVDLDGDFTEHRAELMPCLGFVLQEVLGDFFGAALANGNLGTRAGA